MHHHVGRWQAQASLRHWRGRDPEQQGKTAGATMPATQGPRNFEHRLRVRLMQLRGPASFRCPPSIAVEIIRPGGAALGGPATGPPIVDKAKVAHDGLEACSL